MSDAKAKAEARRAKILARAESSKIAAATPEKDEVEEIQTDEKKKERPLAARRNLVSSSSNQNLNDVKDSDDTKVKTSNPENDPEVESIDEFAKRSSSSSKKVEPSSSKKSLAGDDSTPFMPTTPTTKEIEKAIKEQTAEFDKNVMKKEPPKVKKNAKAASASTVPLQVFHVMKIVRLIGIIVLGIFIGHRSSEFHASKISLLSANARPSTAMNTCAVGETCPSSSMESPDMMRDNLDSYLLQSGEHDTASSSDYLDIMMKSKMSFSTAVADGTWIGWVQNYFIKQAESTITAAGLVWWFARLCNPLVTSLMNTSMFKSPPVKDNTIFQKLLNLYGNGIEGLVESSMGTIGELGLQLVVVIMTCMIIAFMRDNPGFLDSLIDMLMTTWMKLQTATPIPNT